ncbi:ribD, partial [Symbiodinium microadriaticum]
ILIDSQATLSESSQLIATLDQAPVIVAVSSSARSERLERLAHAGCDLIVCEGANHAERIDFLLRELAQRGMTNILVEGGSQLLGLLWDTKEIDEVYAFVAPKIAGGHDAISPVGGQGLLNMEDATSLDVTERLEQVLHFDRTIADVDAFLISGSDDLPHLDTASGETGNPAIGVMFASAIWLEFRCSTELTHPDDESIFQHAALSEISQEHGVALIDAAGQLRVFVPTLFMGVPALIAYVTGAEDFDEADACFDETTSQQTGLTKFGAAISIANRLWFVIKAKRFELGAKHKTLCLLVDLLLFVNALGTAALGELLIEP